MRKDFTPLLQHVGVTFQNQDLLTQAFVHRSYLNENPSFPLGHNERLEFLGDAVLELVITEALYHRYDNPEGELTNWRSSLVNAKMLGGIAGDLGFADYLMLSRGEARDANPKARHTILANTFESFIGALYLDQGYGAAKAFIEQTVLPHLATILKEQLYRDPKSTFQEAAQERLGITPSYRVLSDIGPDHAKVFTVGAYLNDEQVATGQGSSKQEAQVAAADAALKAKGW